MLLLSLIFVLSQTLFQISLETLELDACEFYTVLCLILGECHREGVGHQSNMVESPLCLDWAISNHCLTNEERAARSRIWIMDETCITDPSSQLKAALTSTSMQSLGT